jgi:hypothetical protein
MSYRNDDYAPPSQLSQSELRDALLTAAAIQMAFKDTQDLKRWTPERRDELWRRSEADMHEGLRVGLRGASYTGDPNVVARFHQNYHAAARGFLGINDHTDLVLPGRKENAPGADNSRGAAGDGKGHADSTGSDQQRQPGSPL